MEKKNSIIYYYLFITYVIRILHLSKKYKYAKTQKIINCGILKIQIWKNAKS